MEKLAAALMCAVIGLPLYWLGNRVYHRLARGERPTPVQQVLAVGLSGLSAGVLFVGLILLMSFQAPDFAWDAGRVMAIATVAIVVGLVVAGMTAAKIYAYQRLKKN